MNTIKIKSAFILNFFKFYNILWWLCLPFLRRNKRLKLGFKQRVDMTHLSKASIWIQAASAGEAYLAVNLIQGFCFKKPTKILVTSITSQGLELLNKNLTKDKIDPHTNLKIEWFPFDIPGTMKKAVEIINPDIMVLLETEIWPALLYHLKTNKTKILIVNARLSQNSFKNYMRTRFLWKHLAPDHILATSEQDQKRYAQLFTTANVQTMSNIKFEAITNKELDQKIELKLKKILPENLPLCILASIRKEEENIIFEISQTLLNKFPNQVVAIFPRHMHRIPTWEKMLARGKHNFERRSNLTTPFTGPGIILWDTFGELKNAYGLANVVFVGGSLKPLGGQNFIEPAMQGAVTITGPYYDDFAWATEQIFSQNIVIKKQTPKMVCDTIISTLKHPESRLHRIEICNDYIQSNRGGTAQACHKIIKILQNSQRVSQKR